MWVPNMVGKFDAFYKEAIEAVMSLSFMDHSIITSKIITRDMGIIQGTIDSNMGDSTDSTNMACIN